jgi:hypothetical protein
MVILYAILSFLFGLYCGNKRFRHWVNRALLFIIIKILQLCKFNVEIPKDNFKKDAKENKKVKTMPKKQEYDLSYFDNVDPMIIVHYLADKHPKLFKESK